MKTTTAVLTKGATYRLTVSGVDLVAKITSRSGDMYRAKIAHDRYDRITTFSVLAFHIGQVTRAERIEIA